MSRSIKGVGLLAALAVLLLAIGSPSATGAKQRILKRIALGQLKPAKIVFKIHRNGHTYTVVRTLPFVSAGTIAAARNSLGLGYVSKSAKAKAFDANPPGYGQGEKDVAADAAGGAGLNANGPADANDTGLGISLGTYGCSQRLGNANGENDNGHSNVRVNQDCTFRRQAEEMIRYNPADPSNLLAGQNDSRVGFNQCGIDWSLNNGKNWGDLLPPARQKLNNPAGQEPTVADPNRHTIGGGPGTLHTYDAFSDPALSWDSKGRGFFSCVGFDVFSNASMLYVTQSPKGAHGSFFYNLSSFGRAFMVAEDNNGAVLHDKNFIVADQNPNSPNHDNVYVTWTVFKFDPRCVAGGTQCESPIFGSMSTDHGVHWSTPEQISGTSDTLCFFGDALDPLANPHSCNFDQGSDPAVLPNGDLEVIFNNGNTGAGITDGQQLGVHCHPTGSSPAGTAHLNCAAPALVGADKSTGEPTCNFGRGPEECIPGAYIRTNDFPRITANPSSNTLFATWQDYQRRDNGMKEFSIQMSRSTDGGLTWEPTKTVNPDTGLDHYFPAVDSCKQPSDQKGDQAQKFDAGEGKSCDNTRVGDSYFRTARVPNESAVGPVNGGGIFAPCTSAGTPPPGATSCQGVAAENSDYVLAGGTWPNTPFNFKVVSPVFAPPDGAQAGFNGDYSGLTIQPLGQDESSGKAHPIWSDTRNMDPYSSAQKTAEAGGVNNGVVHDEDVFSDALALPSGTSDVFVGQLGHSGHGG